MKKPLQLHPYQESAVNAACAAIERGESGLIHIATGGGKTVIASEVIRRRSDGYILWITKDWTLLDQAARSVSRQAPHLRLGRIGGSNKVLRYLGEAPNRARVVFTTLHTFVRRVEADSCPCRSAPTLIIYDECHWGESSEVGRTVRTFAKQHGIPVLGLTATPRVSSYLSTLHRTSFVDLIDMGFLAKPLFYMTPTDIQWAPRLQSSASGDFTAPSLRELGENEERNSFIIRQWRLHARKHGPTIVFACDVSHAERLADGFKRAGASVGLVHCRLPEHVNQEELEQYRAGELNVLINVAMLTHGFDAPKTQTIFLTRPTASLILYSQMIGRGSRISEGKTTFNVVQFSDDLRALQNRVMTPGMLFGAAASLAPRRLPHDAKREAFRHQFDPKGRLKSVAWRKGMHRALAGLRYQEGQTFGVELELTRQDFETLNNAEWRVVSSKIIETLRAALGPERVGKVHDSPDSVLNYEVWNVVRDATCGWEVVGAKLSNLKGLLELATACDAISKAALKLDLTVNHRTGLHVHFGWTQDHRSLQRVISGTQRLEPLLASLVAPSRLAHFADGTYDLARSNPYCAPVGSLPELRALSQAKTADVVWAILARMNREGLRYTTVNPLPMGYYSTIEVRMHSGTTDASKVLLWISLWMELLHHFESRSDANAPAARVRKNGLISPRGCLLGWIDDNVPNASATFLDRLDARRKEVKDLWIANAQLDEWVESAMDWHRPQDGRHAAE